MIRSSTGEVYEINSNIINKIWNLTKWKICKSFGMARRFDIEWGWKWMWELRKECYRKNKSGGEYKVFLKQNKKIIKKVIWVFFFQDSSFK